MKEEKHEGVVDRIEDDRVVILVESLKKDVILPVENLSDDIEPGVTVDVFFDEDGVVDIQRVESDQEQKASLEDRLSKLKKSKSKFNKD